LVQTSYQ